MRSEEDITRTVEAHADTVLRVCTLYFGTRPDREDAFQDTFVKYAQATTDFADDEHRKAWLIRVATNVCKDMLKRAEAKTVLTDQVDDAARPTWLAPELGPAETVEAAEAQRGGAFGELTWALEQLDEKYRVVLYLKYYEGYTAAQIAATMNLPENTVYTNLARGREKLKGVLTNAGQGR